MSLIQTTHHHAPQGIKLQDKKSLRPTESNRVNAQFAAEALCHFTALPQLCSGSALAWWNIPQKLQDQPFVAPAFLFWHVVRANESRWVKCTGLHWITLVYTRYLHFSIVFWGVSYVSCLDKTISGASDKLSAARKSEGSRGRCTRRNKSAALRDASKPVSSIFLERVQSKWFQNGRFLWLAMTHAYTGHIWKDSREFNEFPSLCHGGIPMPTHFLCLIATIQIGTHPHRDDPWWPMMT